MNVQAEIKPDETVPAFVGVRSKSYPKEILLQRMADDAERTTRITDTLYVPKSFPFVERAILTACFHSVCDPNDFFGPSKAWPLQYARRAVWIVLERRRWSHNQIGPATGRDRSSVSHGTKIARRRLGTDPWFAALVDKVSRA